LRFPLDPRRTVVELFCFEQMRQDGALAVSAVEMCILPGLHVPTAIDCFDVRSCGCSFKRDAALLLRAIDAASGSLDAFNERAKALLAVAATRARHISPQDAPPAEIVIEHMSSRTAAQLAAGSGPSGMPPHSGGGGSSNRFFKMGLARTSSSTRIYPFGAPHGASAPLPHRADARAIASVVAEQVRLWLLPLLADWQPHADRRVPPRQTTPARGEFA
jgi:hypothetical protein